jgi:hypothetical protein
MEFLGYMSILMALMTFEWNSFIVQYLGNISRALYDF